MTGESTGVALPQLWAAWSVHTLSGREGFGVVAASPEWMELIRHSPDAIKRLIEFTMLRGDYRDDLPQALILQDLSSPHVPEGTRLLVRKFFVRSDAFGRSGGYAVHALLDEQHLLDATHAAALWESDAPARALPEGLEPTSTLPRHPVPLAKAATISDHRDYLVLVLAAVMQAIDEGRRVVLRAPDSESAAHLIAAAAALLRHDDRRCVTFSTFETRPRSDLLIRTVIDEWEDQRPATDGATEVEISVGTRAAHSALGGRYRQAAEHVVRLADQSEWAQIEAVQQQSADVDSYVQGLLLHHKALMDPSGLDAAEVLTVLRGPAGETWLGSASAAMVIAGHLHEAPAEWVDDVSSQLRQSRLDLLDRVQAGLREELVQNLSSRSPQAEPYLERLHWLLIGSGVPQDALAGQIVEHAGRQACPHSRRLVEKAVRVVLDREPRAVVQVLRANPDLDVTPLAQHPRTAHLLLEDYLHGPETPWGRTMPGRVMPEMLVATAQRLAQDRALPAGSAMRSMALERLALLLPEDSSSFSRMAELMKSDESSRVLLTNDLLPRRPDLLRRHWPTIRDLRGLSEPFDILASDERLPVPGPKPWWRRGPDRIRARRHGRPEGRTNGRAKEVSAAQLQAQVDTYVLSGRGDPMQLDLSQSAVAAEVLHRAVKTAVPRGNDEYPMREVELDRLTSLIPADLTLRLDLFQRLRHSRNARVRTVLVHDLIPRCPDAAAVFLQEEWSWLRQALGLDPAYDVLGPATPSSQRSRSGGTVKPRADRRRMAGGVRGSERGAALSTRRTAGRPDRGRRTQRRGS